MKIFPVALASWSRSISHALMVLTISAAWTSVAAQDSYTQFRAALIHYFERDGFFPVLINRGYEIGDVLNMDGVEVHARASRCFPSLKQPRAIESPLTHVVEVDAGGFSFGLRLKRLFSSSAAAEFERSFRISFDDVKVASVARRDLIDALDNVACPEIRPLLSGEPVPVNERPSPYFIISEIMYGKRRATLKTVSAGDVRTRLEQLGQIVGDANIRAHAELDGSISLQNEQVLPIAVKPAAVPKVFKARSLGPLPGEEVLGEEWRAFRPDGDPETKALFSQFVNRMAATQPTLSEQDTEQ